MKFQAQVLIAVLLLAGRPLAAQSVLLNPPGKQVVTQPSGSTFSVNYFETQQLNGIPQADRFSGSDICAKMKAAILYALNNGINQVDATHFHGTQSCASNPFYGIAASGSSVNLVLRLGAVHIQTSVPWNIANGGVSLIGMGPMNTQLEYTGPSTAPGILEIYSSPPGSLSVESVRVTGLFLYGGAKNVTDGILAERNHRSIYTDVRTWGVTGCGIHTKFAVTDTFISPRTSGEDARLLGIDNSSHTTPTSGLCFDRYGGGQTTDGTVVDAGAEGVTGAGWNLISAASMTFTSGTSENNTPSRGPGGVNIQDGSNHNVFLSCDFEGNSNEDVLDNGNDTHLIAVIAASKGSIQLGPTSAYASISSTTAQVYASPGASRFETMRGGEFVSTHQSGVPFNGGARGWNGLGNGEADYYTDVKAGPYSHAFFEPNRSGGFQLLGGFQTSGTFNAEGGFSNKGTAGFSGVKSVGSCKFTISGGIITGITGC